MLWMERWGTGRFVRRSIQTEYPQVYDNYLPITWGAGWRCWFLSLPLDIKSTCLGMEPGSLPFTHFLVILLYITVREVIRVVNRCSGIVSCTVMRSATKSASLWRAWEPKVVRHFRLGSFLEKGVHGIVFPGRSQPQGQALASAMSPIIWLSPSPLSLPSPSSFP